MPANDVFIKWIFGAKICAQGLVRGLGMD